MMFSTLRQTFGDGDRLLNVEIVPPFDKDRTSMRSACERCRTQKSKCVSGENGCMLCVIKNKKCEYAVVSRPQRHTSRVGGGDSKSRGDDNNNNNKSSDSGRVITQQRPPSNLTGSYKRRSRVQHTTRQTSPSSTASSSTHEESTKAPPVSKPSLQENVLFAPGPEDASQQLFFSDTTFPDSPGRVSAVFPELDPGTSNLYGSVASHRETTRTTTTQGDKRKHSQFDFGFDQMDFMMDDKSMPTSMAPSVSVYSTKATSSSCSCMMTAVGIYEALQQQLAWGDPVAGLSPTSSTPESTSAESSPYSSLSCWSGPSTGSASSVLGALLESDLGHQSSTKRHRTSGPLMSQQTILQRQKTMLARFESLLGCSSCWSRPDFVMLMITMCDRILTSLEAVERFVSSRSDDMNNKAVASSNNITSVIEVNAMAATRSEIGIQQQQPRVGTWQIDDDDELELVISLIKSRVTRLGNLIAMAEGTVSANAWLSHERLAQALRRRSNKLLLSLSFRGFS